MHIKNLCLTSTFALLFAGLAWAQIPDTAAGRAFSAWLKAINTEDSDTIQQVIEKNMSWATTRISFRRSAPSEAGST